MADRSWGLARAEQVDAFGEVAGGGGGAALVVEHDGLSDAEAVSGSEEDLVDGLVVDVGAVGGAEVDDLEGAGIGAGLGGSQFGVAAGDFVVVEADRVGNVAADRHGGGA